MCLLIRRPARYYPSLRTLARRAQSTMVLIPPTTLVDRRAPPGAQSVVRRPLATPAPRPQPTVRCPARVPRTRTPQTRAAAAATPVKEHGHRWHHHQQHHEYQFGSRCGQRSQQQHEQQHEHQQRQQQFQQRWKSLTADQAGTALTTLRVSAVSLL
jgi:hypothetical protein